jgi:hypothetical protein
VRAVSTEPEDGRAFFWESCVSLVWRLCPRLFVSFVVVVVVVLAVAVAVVLVVLNLFGGGIAADEAEAVTFALVLRLDLLAVIGAGAEA